MKRPHKSSRETYPFVAFNTTTMYISHLGNQEHKIKIKPIHIAHTPTPLYRLERLSDLWKGEVWIKRDDMTGAGLSGNKVRKLEFLAADAISQGADTLVTCGGIQSNHCRATAITAAQLGMKCHLLLRGDPVEEPDGNLLIDKLVGAKTEFVPDERYYGDIQGEFNRIGEQIRRDGGIPYMIPEGGSNAIGAWGYVQAAKEAYKQCEQAGFQPDRIICATGSGGTHAGLLIGARLLNWDTEILSVAVCYDGDETQKIIHSITREMIETFGLDIRCDLSDVRIIDGYRGPGYAKANTEIFKVIIEVAHTEGILVDPVYTGKQAWAVKEELASGHLPGATLFWHTGGMFGIFPFRNSLVDVLNSRKV